MGMDGEYILKLSRSYWGARALFWGVEMDVFTLLETREMSSPEIAKVLNTEPAATERVLLALVSLGFLLVRNGRYRNTVPATEHLVRGKNTFLGNAVRHDSKLWEGWARLDEAVRTGKGAAFDIVEKEPYEQRLEVFLMAMRDRAILAADKIISHLNWGSFHEMLDLGAGPGAYTEALLKKFPNLKSTVYDLDKTIKLAKEILKESCYKDRINYRSGDFTRDDLGEEKYDAVLAANIAHMYDSATNQILVKKICKALRPGGHLAVYDYVLDENSPAKEAALFDLNMLIGTVNGRNYSCREIAKWFSEAGFDTISQFRVSEGISLNIAVKPLFKKH